MKNKITIVLIVCIIGGCKKDPVALNSQLQGTWELVKSYSGWGGVQEYSSGNGNTLKFSENSFVRNIKTTDTTFAISGTFSVYTGKPCEYASEQTLIKFNHDEISSSVSILNGELTIGTTECVADGGSSTYKKIAN